VIRALRHWRVLALAGLVLAVPLAWGLGRWQGATAREAELRAEAADARLRVITEERNRTHEIDALPDADLRRRLDQWVRQ
jgi:hypothetical protein